MATEERRCRECGHDLGGEIAREENWTVCGGGEHCTCLAAARAPTVEAG